jgi:hypothetical protein
MFFVESNYFFYLFLEISISTHAAISIQDQLFASDFNLLSSNIAFHPKQMHSLGFQYATRNMMVQHISIFYTPLMQTSEPPERKVDGGTWLDEQVVY